MRLNNFVGDTMYFKPHKAENTGSAFYDLLFISESALSSRILSGGLVLEMCWEILLAGVSFGSQERRVSGSVGDASSPAAHRQFSSTRCWAVAVGLGLLWFLVASTLSKLLTSVTVSHGLYLSCPWMHYYRHQHAGIFASWCVS